MSKRFPTKNNALMFLCDAGLTVNTVIDVGVMRGTPALMSAFPSTKHLLLEPVQEYQEAIAQNYSHIDHDLIQVAVSSTDGEGSLQVIRLDGSNKITHSYLIEDGGNLARWKDPDDIRKVDKITLDSLLSKIDCLPPYLLKIDTDGNELAVLKGAEKTMQKTSCLVLEAPLNLLGERLQYVENIGFRLWDIVDLCYYAGHANQVDLVFLSHATFDKDQFNPWRSSFSFDKWYELKDCD